MSRVSPVRRASVALVLALAGYAAPPTRELSIAGQAAAIAKLEAALAAPEARRVPAPARRRGQAAIARAKPHAAVTWDAAELHDPRIGAEGVEQVERIMAELDAALAGLSPTPTTRSRRR
jgi:hypothetical protein